MFEPNRSLLNPMFEGYKLDALDQDKAISRFSLQFRLSQLTHSGRAPLSFQEVQSRIRHNHLTVGPNKQVLYVDAEFRLVAITLDETSLVPSFRLIYELPRPVKTTEQSVIQQEYPSSVFLNGDVVFVSDGYGALYAISTWNGGEARPLNEFELVIPDGYQSSQRSVPFRVHHAQAGLSQGTAILILSSKYHPEQDKTDKPVKRGHLSSVEFDVWAVEVDLNAHRRESPLPLNILWHRRGEDVPQHINFDNFRQAFMILGSCPYRTIHVAPPSFYEPTSDEIAPIPRQGEVLDGSSGTGTTSQPLAPPPYSWTQTSDSITITFPLPSPTPKSAIKVMFTPRTLTVLVSSDPPSPSVHIPKFTARDLWDGIQPTTSFWTWDKEDNRSFGVLTLHLDKLHDGTRWAQIFAKGGTQSSTPASIDEVEVPETLDPSELYNIREALEKFTESLQGEGRGSIPSLAEGEMDEEIDSELGKWFFATWVGADGGDPTWSNERGMNAPLSVLSTPLPGVHEPRFSVALKNGVDGIVFTLQDGSSPSDPPMWQHTSTFSALSFVLASKRDTRFVHHVSSQAVLAFESGSRGNVYIYCNTVGPRDKTAKQAVLKISGGSGGSLLGVGVINTPQHGVVILGLCEGEFVIARDVL